MTPPSEAREASPSTGPTTGLVDLRAAGDELLASASTRPNGRAARTLTPGAGTALSQTLLALTAGNELQEHVAPGPATLQVLAGHAVVTAGGDTVEIAAGQWSVIPPRPHGLRAEQDLVALLTVAPRGGRPATA